MRDHDQMDDALEASEMKMQRESYERAGEEAWLLGVPRSSNPFVRRIDSLSAPEEREKFRRLAGYWFCGWDHADAARMSQKRRGRRREQSAPVKDTLG